MLILAARRLSIFLFYTFLFSLKDSGQNFSETLKCSIMKGAIRMSEAASTNRNYKDSLFRMIFREKEKLLNLYHAITGTH